MVKRKKSFRDNKPVKFVKYGNWCGPGWTAGKAMDAEDMQSSDYNVPAVNAIDQSCKDHDIAINEAETKEDVSNANEEFVMDARGEGYTGKAMGELVSWFGPGDVSNKKKDPHYPKSAEGKNLLNFKIQKKMLRYQGNNFGAPAAPAPTDSDMGVSATAGKAGRGATGKNNEGETPVDVMPTLKYLPFRPTEQVFMKYRGKFPWTVGTGDITAAVFADTFRLNSIYDIKTSHGYSTADPPVPVADTADGTVQTPTMRNYWMAIYHYWTVVRVHYKVKFWCTTLNSSGEVMVYRYYHGQQHPPTIEYANPNFIKHFERKNHPDMEYKKITTITSGNELNRFNQGVEFSGTFTPGELDSTVAEDEYSETWHKKEEVPSHRELMSFIVHRSDRAADAAYSGEYEIELAYEVQLKDLKVQHQYISRDSAIPNIPAYAASAN